MALRVDAAVEEVHGVRPGQLVHRVPLPRLQRERGARPVRDLQLVDGDALPPQPRDRGPIVLHPGAILVYRVEDYGATVVPMARTFQASSAPRVSAYRWAS